MTGSEKLISFWSSLITEKGLAPHVNTLMDIDDLEERGISMISRVVFLWSMGMKYKIEKFENLKQAISDIVNGDSNKDCGNCSQIKVLIEKGSISQSNDKKSSETNTQSCFKRKRLNSPEKAQNILRSKENIGTQEPDKFRKILAPETEFFSQTEIMNESYEPVIIPETIPIDQNTYGNTDFFENMDDDDDILLADHFSPKSDKCEGNKSPVLGKQSKLTSTPVFGRNIRTPIQKGESALKENTSIEKVQEGIASSKAKKCPVLESLDSSCHSPSLLGCDGLKSPASQTKEQGSYSSLNEKQNSTSHSEEKICNTWKKPDRKSPLSRVSSPTIATTSSNSDVSANYNDKTSPFPPTNPTKGLLTKSKSELGGTSKKNTRLSRVKTLSSLKTSNLPLEIEISSTPKPPKKYKQTQITKDGFLKKPSDAKSPEKSSSEDELLAKVIQKSIRSMEIEDLMRNKRKQLQTETPPKLKKCSPAKRKKGDPKSVDGVRTSPRLQVKGGSQASPKLTEDEVLAQLEEESGKEEGSSSGANEKTTSRRKKLFQDSFDLLPAKEGDHSFAYKDDVVRKKTERKKLDGWDCLECKDYFEARGVTDSERKEVKNKCSRHRGKHQAVTNTPEGFWQVGWRDYE